MILQTGNGQRIDGKYFFFEDGKLWEKRACWTCHQHGQGASCPVCGGVGYVLLDAIAEHGQSILDTFQDAAQLARQRQHLIARYGTPNPARIADYWIVE